MRQTGIVVEIVGDIAKVECSKQSACEMCENSAGCAEKCEKVYASAMNDIKAEVGDMVEIETNTRRLLINSFVVFIMPILLAVLAYFCTDSFFNETVAVVVTFIVLVFSLILFAFLLNWLDRDKIISRVVKILD